MSIKARVKRLEEGVGVGVDLVTRMEISFIETDGSCNSRLVSEQAGSKWVARAEILKNGEWVPDA